MKLFPAAVYLLGGIAAANASCPPPQADLGGPYPRPGDATALLSSIESLRAHVLTTAAAYDGSFNATAIVTTVDSFAANAAQLTSSNAVLTAALSLVDDYEASALGPMYLDKERFTRDYFSRIPLEDDNLEIDRAMMKVQQAVLDEVYHASNWEDRHSDPVDWPYKPSWPLKIVARCWTDGNGSQPIIFPAGSIHRRMRPSIL